MKITGDKLCDWSRYHDFISDNFLYVCKDLDVVEIASFDGHQTLAIEHNQPRSLTLIEPNPAVTDKLKRKFPAARIIAEDAFEVYKHDVPADVVVCCGFLYHLHSPLFLLELIVEKSDPKFIVLDCTNVESFEQGNEEINTPGNRFSSLKKTAGVYVVAPYATINLALENLGYKLIQYQDLGVLDVETKENSWMAAWEKQ